MRSRGFAFDPAHAFEKFDLSGIKNVERRRETYRQMASLASETGAKMSFCAEPEKPVAVCPEPVDIEKIRETLAAVKKVVDEHKDGEPYIFPALQVSLGHIAKERFEAIGMLLEDNVEVIFESPGKSDYGMKHWRRHHLNDWKKPDAVDNFIGMMAETIWNPAAKMTNTLSKNGKRISITSPDGKYLANLWKKGEKWVYSIQDVWDQSESRRERE